MDLQATNTQLLDLTPWLEIDGGKATRVVDMPVGYLGRRNTALNRLNDLGRQIGFSMPRSTMDTDVENQVAQWIKNGQNLTRISLELCVK